MESLTIHFEVGDDVDAGALTHDVEARLAELDGVEHAQAAVSNERIGVAEAVAVISGIVLLTRSAREGVEEVKKLLESVRQMLDEVKGVRGAYLDIAGRKVPLDREDEVLAALQEE